MLRAKADRAAGHLISQVVCTRFFLSNFALRRARLFELRPGLLGDAYTDSWRLLPGGSSRSPRPKPARTRRWGSALNGIAPAGPRHGGPSKYIWHWPTQ